MSYESMVNAAIDVIWNDADLDRIPEFYADDFVSHQTPLGIRWEPPSMRTSIESLTLNDRPVGAADRVPPDPTCGGDPTELTCWGGSHPAAPSPE